MKLLTATIVVYKNDRNQLLNTINSFLSTEIDVHLYIVDNSPTDHLRDICNDCRVTYFFMNSNYGFGAGHNFIMRQKDKMGIYHVILNPDISFKARTLEGLIEYMENNLDVGNIMPKIVYPDGTLQYLCKLLPTPKDWIIRIFVPIKAIVEKIDYNFEMKFSGYNKEMNVPYLSGCFMFLRSSIIREIGLFDEGIFMYGEDTDLNRRIHRKYRTMFYPNISIIHNFEKGSHKNIRLFWIHIKAAVYYMNKWGWIFDNERTEFNNKAKMLYGADKKG